MEKTNILQFNRDDKFYFKKGNDFLSQGNVSKAIKYFQKAVNEAQNKNAFLRCSYYLVLAQAYSLAQNMELSNFYYFKALENDVFAQLVFRGLGENFLHQNDELTARFYLNQCVNLLENSQVANSAKERLDGLDKASHKKFKVIYPNSCDGLLSKTEGLMSRGKFDDVVALLESEGNYKDPKVRAELSLAYFFTNQTKKGLELVENYGDDSVFDLCNLLLIYYCEEDKVNFEATKTKLRAKDKISDEEYFKIGLTFAQTNELQLAKTYMKEFLSKSNPEPDLLFLYCITLMNNGDFDEAKSLLLDLKNVDPFNNYIFNYYLKICAEKPKECKLEYIFSIPVSEFLKVQVKLKEFLTLELNELLNEFKSNQDLFYFVASLPDSNTKNAVLEILSKIDDDCLNNYFSYILLTNSAKNSLKNKLALNRLVRDGADRISVVKDKIFTKYVVPNMLATKLNNQSLFDATVLCLKFLIEEALIMNVNLKREVIKLERIIKDTEQNQNVLACFMAWDYTKQKKVMTLNKICKTFNVTQEELYNFANSFGLEI